jgi:hypothetical protein
MVLDNDLHDQIKEIYETSMKDIMAYALHMDLFEINYRERLHSLFMACIERLQQYLEDAEPTNKVMFIQSRLKDLRLRELNKRSMKDSYNGNNEYSSILKEYLEIEAEFIKETKDISFFDKAQPIKRVQAKSNKKLSSGEEVPFTFGYKAQSIDPLKEFVLELNRQIYLLKDNEDAVDNFISVLTSDDLSQKLPTVTFNCETTQLYYIFNNLKPFFKNLTFKNIEKSQLFFTKNGNHLKGQNLSASKVDFPKNYEEIDRAFTHLQ